MESIYIVFEIKDLSQRRKEDVSYLSSRQILGLRETFDESENLIREYAGKQGFHRVGFQIYEYCLDLMKNGCPVAVQSYDKTGIRSERQNYTVGDIVEVVKDDGSISIGLFSKLENQDSELMPVLTVEGCPFYQLCDARNILPLHRRLTKKETAKILGLVEKSQYIEDHLESDLSLAESQLKTILRDMGLSDVKVTAEKDEMYLLSRLVIDLPPFEFSKFRRIEIIFSPEKILTDGPRTRNTINRILRRYNKSDGKAYLYFKHTDENEIQYFCN